MPSRRQLLQLLPGGLILPSGLLGPRPGLAAPSSASERRFLFVFCSGGWDTSYVFTPFDEIGFETAGIRFVDHPSSPSVSGFFEAYGDRTCVLNGIEIRSVTHERCQRIAMTGSSETGRDDWAALLAASSRLSLPCPHLVLRGPCYTHDTTQNVVRVGESGQLTELLSGAALSRAEPPFSPLDSDIEALVDGFVRQRIETAAATAGRGRAHNIALDYASALDNAAALAAHLDSLSLKNDSEGCTRNLSEDAAMAFSCFEQGISRCAMIESLGWCGTGWDTHQSNERQSDHFELLFAELTQLMDDLAGRTAPSGAPLADELTIVVLSEMGRHPQRNTWGGKDHWTFTSAMLLGAGVAGGQSIGALDENASGQRIDLETGGVDASGTALLADHLGATLLALGDVDPERHLPGISPITAALR